MKRLPPSAVVLLASVLYLALLHCGVAQNCEGGGSTFVGFTALTPDQLKQAIEDSVQSSVSEALSAISTDQEDSSEGLLALNETLTALVDRSSKLEKTLATTVHAAVVNSVMANVERFLKSSLREAVVNLTRVIQQLNIGSVTLSPPPSVSTPPPNILPPTQVSCLLGSSPTLPASSCKQIYNINSSCPSGFYWVGGGQGPPHRLYCDMKRTCGGVVGGWTRIANLDMTNSSQSCPLNLVEVSLDPKRPRLCTVSRDASVGCFSTLFPVQGVSYERVCGRVIAYQDRTPNAFFPYRVNQSLTIDDVYMDGVSITHGQKPRQHIWSFVAALDESSGHQSGCPCLNVASTTQATIPPFVGNDYFCDTGSADDVRNIFYPDDPLWDGEGCGELNTCCSFNNPPWFSKTLSRPVSDDVEMRVCRDAGYLNEDIPIEAIELYVR